MYWVRALNFQSLLVHSVIHHGLFAEISVIGDISENLIAALHLKS
uniref:Uncharacterized protein n=1 Tax=Rhizophora mucronata TaxID=61149 RepID=A0A2P2PPV7_RHIMU